MWLGSLLRVRLLLLVVVAVAMCNHENDVTCVEEATEGRVGKRMNPMPEATTFEVAMAPHCGDHERRLGGGSSASKSSATHAATVTTAAKQHAVGWIGPVAAPRTLLLGVVVDCNGNHDNVIGAEEATAERV
jgi:hypothetical protein